VNKLVKQLIYFSVVLTIVLVGCSEKQPNPTRTFSGYVETTQVNVNTRIPGKIVSILVDEGDKVTKGDTIAILDTREMLANRKALLSMLKNIEVNKTRVYNLYNAGAVPKQKVDEIETNYSIVKNKIAALDAKIEDMTIRSPITGIVVAKILEEGQMMPPGMPVVIVTDTNTVYARFSIPETYLSQIKLGNNLTLATPIKNKTVSAKVFQVIPMADFATKLPTDLRDERDVRSFSVKMKFNKYYEFLKSGMSVYLKLNNPDYKGE
jgi:membrane fusion protein (multidrug efflux system)